MTGRFLRMRVLALRLLHGLQLGGELVDGGYVVEAGQVGVPGEGFALFAVDQNLYLQDAWDICRESVDERSDGEIFHQDSGAVAVGEGGVEIDDCDAGVDQKNAADVR